MPLSYRIALLALEAVTLLGVVAILLAPREGRRAGKLLGATAVLSLAGWLNFGLLHGAGVFVHAWEQFHYALGSKYFDELGYDGLYVASLQAQVETAPGLPLPAVTRDLRNNWLVPTPTLETHAAEVKARFTPERWHEFLRDHATYLELVVRHAPAGHLGDIRRDHGFHATPSWIACARTLLFGRITQARAVALGAVDLLLAAAMLVAIARTYGSRAACIAAIVFGTGHAWAFYWIGGGFLRMDWLLLVALAACAARSGRLAASGALLGVASALRLFPAALALGPAIACLRDAWQERSIRRLLRFLGGMTLAAAVTAGLGCTTSRGPGAWREFASAIRLHEGTWLTNNVGLRAAVAYGPGIVARGYDEAAAGRAWGDHLDETLARRRALLAVLAAAMLGMIALAAARLPPDEALVATIPAIYALSNLTGYYWIALTLLALRPGRVAAAACVAIAAACRALALAGAPDETVYGGMAFGLGIVFAAWLLPDAWRTTGDLRSGTLTARRAPDPAPTPGPAGPPPDR